MVLKSSSVKSSSDIVVLHIPRSSLSKSDFPVLSGGEKKDEIGRVTKVLRAAAVDQGDRSEMKKAGFFAASLAAAYLAAASSAALADASPDPQASSFSSKEVRLSSPSPPGS
ncbi:hypothetical protein B296_00008587 [Ensete ventricosum]|uniref:Uncharacterized protein n=1 Tax=Ensete ventricosum TaxID=4639 RepID=A0A427APE3_ENSVE|nr:hypothetical protein B296_00008587 [Ensete ventricosum]